MGVLSEASITRAINALKSVVTAVKALKRQQTYLVVKDRPTIAVGAYVEYDLHTLSAAVMPQGMYDSCDWLGTQVTAWVIDSAAGSPTYNNLISGEAYLTTALKGTRYLRIYNNSDLSVVVEVRARVALLQAKVTG